MIFVVSDDLKKISKIESGSFAELDIWERAHIQEWVRSLPEMLGEDLLIVSREFDKFTNSKDRLDLLAIDGGRCLGRRWTPGGRSPPFGRPSCSVGCTN